MKNINALHAKCLYLLEEWKITKVKEIFEKIKEYKDKEYISLIKDIGRKIELCSRFMLQDIKWKKTLYFYIINDCDYKCCFCDRSDPEINKYNFHTTLEDIKFILKVNKQYKFHSFAVWWHEPLANSNIFEIINYIYKFNKNIVLYTSWSRPKELEKLLNDKYIKEVYLPIYSTDNKIHDSITQIKWSFKDFKECEKLLKENKVKYWLNSVLINKNIWDIDLFKICNFTLLLPNNLKPEEFYKNNWIRFKEYIEAFKAIYKKWISINKYFSWEFWLPLCVLKQIDNKLFLKAIKEGSRDSLVIENYKDSDMFDIKESYWKYKKVEACKKCNLYNRCNWYYKLYFDVFWENEVMPVID